MLDIRKATPADGPAILECLARAFEPFRAAYTPAGFADTVLSPETIDQRFRHMTLFVATEGGRIVGTIGCARSGGGEGHIRGMAVLPEWQGRGVAERLLMAAEAELRSAGCAAVTLDTTAPLQRAIRFYQKHGYRATGRVGDFFGMALYEYEKRVT